MNESAIMKTGFNKICGLLQHYSLVLLLSIIADVYDLQDVVVGAELQRPNVDLDVLLQEILGKLANLFGPSGAPHQSLTVRLQKHKTVSNTFPYMHSTSKCL